jgi:hypothetical protein
MGPNRQAINPSGVMTDYAMSALVTTVCCTLETSWMANFAQSSIDETPHHIHCIAFVKN